MKHLSALLSTVLILISLCGCSRVTLNNSTDAVLRFHYGEADIQQTLTSEEASAVIELLDGKRHDASSFFSIPSCGFSSDVSITVDGTCFALACDKCNIIQNCNTLQYINISASERAVLEAIFEKYGGFFPCL